MWIGRSGAFPLARSPPDLVRLLRSSLQRAPSQPHMRGMIQRSIIYDPVRLGGPFIAALFDPTGRPIASRSCATRESAELFVQAFMQENAGEYGLSHHPASAEHLETTKGSSPS